MEAMKKLIVSTMAVVAVILTTPAFACVGSVCVCWHNICL
jgi:hypothetical protein